MNKILICKLFFLSFLLSSKSFALEQSKIENKKISDLPVFVTKIENLNANLIGIIGGKGMKNEIGKSKNFLKRYKDNFVEKGIAFYLFPNVNSFTKASYPRRISEDRIGRLNELVKYISNINDKPIFIIGFSRGAVDAGFYAKKYPESISGIILASGIYKNDSNKAFQFYPYAQITRAGKPEGRQIYILHEGFLGVFGDELKEKDYSDIDDEKFRFKEFKAFVTDRRPDEQDRVDFDMFPCDLNDYELSLIHI